MEWNPCPVGHRSHQLRLAILINLVSPDAAPLLADGEQRAPSDVIVIAGTAAYRRSPSYVPDITLSDILAYIAGALVSVVAVVLAIGHYLPRGKRKNQ
ncbi:MAG: hypothetical protein K0R53_2448 [Burkholderiales bacterium]|jgi:hypothetical protein|nr:hypothetical protein [Burkholderiales bacterium]